MMKKAFLIIASIIFFVDSVYSDETLIASGHPNQPAFSWVEEKGTEEKILGIGAELTKLIFNDFGINVDSKYVGNWKRVLYNAEYGDIDVVVAVYINDKRKTYMDYPSSPYMLNSSVIWVRKGNEFPFEKWEDLIGKTGTAVIGEKFSVQFDEFIKSANLEIQRIPDFIHSLRKLEKGRVDYMPFSLMAGRLQIKKLGYEGKIINLSTPIYSGDVYLSMSKKSKFCKYLPQVEKSIQKYKVDGTIGRLIEKSIEDYSNRKVSK